MRISIALSAVILGVIFLPTGSSSLLSLSTAVASPDDNQEQEHCPGGINHVPRESHAYEVLVSICEGEKGHENPK
jgi:hypothetical protein